MKVSRNLVLWLPALVVLGVGLACATLNTVPGNSTSTPGAKPEITSSLPESVSATQTSLASIRITTPTLPGATPTPTIQNVSHTPWLVYASADGTQLVARQADQTNPVTIALPGRLLYPTDLERGASPDGEWLALRTAQADGSGMALTLVHLADGTAQAITPLLNAGLEQQALNAGSGAKPDAVFAVEEEHALQWSPDSRYLAFIAAADGPSSDLYAYDVQTAKLDRLTSGLNQAATPTWSPDSKWIVHQEVRTFGDGTAWTVTAVWAIAIDHNETRRLYTPLTNSLGETFLSWTQSDTLLYYSMTSGGGRSVREIPMSARWVYVLYKGPFEDIAFAPSDPYFAIVQNQATGTEAGVTPGIYLLKAYEQPVNPVLVQVGEWYSVSWWPDAGIFIALGNQGALALQTNEKSVLFSAETHAIPSPDGQWIVAWNDDQGLRIYQPSGTRLQTISAAAVQSVAWLPDSAGFYYLDGTDLYEVVFPVAQPQLVASGVGNVVVVK